MDYITYCKIYRDLFKSCVENNKEVFGEEYKNFCMKYLKGIELYCKN